MLVIVLLGALAARFTTGFAGFGTGLVASGLWFHPLPASMVPPLVALASVAAQSITSLQRQWKLRIPRSNTRNRLAVALIAEQVPIGVRSKAQRSHGKIDIVESR
jgi:uncharacterized membrane protein YfcA